MFDLIPTTTQTASSDHDLHQAFLDNPNLFPEIADPTEREEAVSGFEKYLKIIDDIFKDELGDRELEHATEEDTFLGKRGRKDFVNQLNVP